METVVMDTVQKQGVTGKESIVMSRGKQVPALSLVSSGLQKLQAIEIELNIELKERESEIRSVILALMTSRNVLFLGKPGTAKSMLAEYIAEHITGATYFQWLLGRTSEPSEVLGPISIKAMENDQFLRKPAGKLPEADIAFIDEIFKANSATLNTLLPILNEKKWYNDGIAHPVPLKVCIGASNEFPEDDDLGAFYDRFLFRHWVEYVGDSQNRFNMMNEATLRRANPTQRQITQITMEELEAVQNFVNQMPVPGSTITSFMKLEAVLRKKDIKISDRRAVSCIHIMQATAALSGAKSVDPDHMEHLCYILWDNRDDIEDIKAELTKMMNPFKDKINTAFREAQKIQAEVMGITDNTDRANKAIDARTTLEKIARRMTTVIEEATKEGRDTTEFTKLRDRVGEINSEIVNKCLLFSVNSSAEEGDSDLPF
jgi:MoxR-like ATPase